MEVGEEGRGGEGRGDDWRTKQKKTNEDDEDEVKEEVYTVVYLSGSIRMYEGGCMCLTVRCEFRVAKASINVPSPAAYPISDIRYPRLWLRTLTLSRSDAHERGLARHVAELHFKRGRARFFDETSSKGR